MASGINLDGFRLAITGVDGFVGRHLAKSAADQGATIFGVGRSEHLDPALHVRLREYITADLRSVWPLTQQVDAVVHLAGLSAVGPSFDQPQRYIEENSAIVTMMCERLLEHDRPPRVIGVSTGAVYQNPAEGAPIDEATLTHPGSPYALSKLLVETQLSYFRSRGLDAIVARPFNHVGAGQRGGFLIPDLVRRLTELAPGQPLTVGELGNSRDYTHVADVAEAYLQLASAPALRHEMYNVASGRSTEGRRVLEIICRLLGREVPELRVNPSLLRPNDPRVITGSAARLRQDTGWVATRSLEEAIADFIAASADDDSTA